MVPILALWLPIVLSAVAVFLVSSVIHMVLKYHRTDFRGVPAEGEVMETLRRFQIPPGQYMVPHAESPEAMKSEEFQTRMAQGPVAIMVVMEPGTLSMGKNLALWFGYSLLVGVFAAYIAGRALGPGADYLSVFRFAGATALAGYGLALLQGSIWYGRPWSITLKSVFDAVVYALVTAGFFGWLWPA